MAQILPMSWLEESMLVYEHLGNLVNNGTNLTDVLVRRINAGV